MPTSAELLQQLAAIADAHPLIAIAWHVVILVAIAWFVLDAPTAERATGLAIAPITSVFLVSAGHESWFNSASFGALAVALLVARGQLGSRWRTDVPAWATAYGAALILFGAWYPHFTTAPWYEAIFTSPIGLLPCPTLAVVAGFTLLAGGFGSRAFPAVLAVWTTLYATFGALRLGVQLDLGLFVAAFGLGLLAIRKPHVLASSPV